VNYPHQISIQRIPELPSLAQLSLSGGFSDYCWHWLGSRIKDVTLVVVNLVVDEDFGRELLVGPLVWFLLPQSKANYFAGK